MNLLKIMSTTLLPTFTHFSKNFFYVNVSMEGREQVGFKVNMDEIEYMVVTTNDIGDSQGTWLVTI